MNITVLSGKGGPGKTTVAACLHRVWPNSRYMDCDVEEPNGALFLQPDLVETEVVNVLVPQIDASRCILCGKCADICQFHALAVLPTRVMIFPELCHSCGACSLVCPTKAIQEAPRRIGVVENNVKGTFCQGRLDVGEPMGIPIISALKHLRPPNNHLISHSIFDSSPGTSCAVVRTLEGSDFALIVTEPTPFGLHDLKIAVELVHKLAIPAGVVLNKAGPDPSQTEDFLSASGIPVLLKIPFSRTIARGYSEGILPVDLDPHWFAEFLKLAQTIIDQGGRLR